MDEFTQIGGDFGTPYDDSGGGAEGGWNAPLSTGTGAGLKPVTVIIGLIGLLLIMRVLGESDKTGIEPAHIHIGPYNLIGITAIAITGIALAKLVFNKFQVGGITDLVNAV